MLDKFATFDGVLIDKVFQPLANALAEVGEGDCFRAARVGTDAAALAWILSRAGAASDAFAGSAQPHGVFQLVMLILGLGALTALRSLFQRTSGTGGPASAVAGANPLRPTMLLHRACIVTCLIAKLLTVAISPVTFDATAAVVMLLLLAASLYIGACTTPPATRDRRQARIPGLPRPST